MWGEDEPSDGVVLCSTHPLSPKRLYRPQQASKQAARQIGKRSAGLGSSHSHSLFLYCSRVCGRKKKSELAIEGQCVIPQSTNLHLFLS